MIAANFLPEAEKEFLEETEYYSQARTGLGVRFQNAVEAALSRAQNHPHSGAPTDHHTRAIGVKGFPFRIIYRIDQQQLLVVAIAHHRRKPAYWLGRIK